MAKKIVGILLIGLLVSTVFPVVCSVNQPKHSPQVEIKIKGGFGVQAIIKNIGTTDINNADIAITLDGSKILWGKQKVGGKISIGAGKTHYMISPVFGFGITNIEITIGSTTQMALAKVMFCFIYDVK